MIVKRVLSFYHKLSFIQGIVITITFTSVFSFAAVNIPDFYTFTAGTPISSSQINSNFEKLAGLIDNGRSQNYIGTWDTINNVPDIESTSPIPGDYYISTSSGNHTFTNGENLSFSSGDWVIFNGISWEKLQASSWNFNGNDTFYNSGKVGIGTSAPQVKLDINGGLKLGNESSACISALAGTMRFVSSSFEYCNGSTWTVFGGGGAGTVTNVSATAPLTVTTGSTAPQISLLQANGSNPGYLSSVDWNLFNNKEAPIAPGSTAQYFRGDKTWYSLETAVLALPLTGLSVAQTTSVTATDTLLGGIGKLQGQLSSMSSTFIDWATTGAQTIDPARLSLGISAPNKTITTNSSGFLVASNVTSSELGYLSGVTSPIQAQLNSKISSQWATSGAHIYFSSGNIGIGISTPAYPLDVIGDIRTSSCVQYNAGVLGTCASDVRIKKDIHPFTLGLQAILGINPVNYKYNGLAGQRADEKVKLGVIAQQVELVAPELVKKQMVLLHPEDQEKSEIKVVDYGAFTYMAINAIKQFYRKWFDDSQLIHQKLLSMQLKTSELEAKNNILKKENQLMKSRLDSIEKMLKLKKVE